MKQILIIIAALVALSAQASDRHHHHSSSSEKKSSSRHKVTITVSNPTDTPRSGEMVEVDSKAVQKKLKSETFIVTDADGREIPSQVTYDGKLIFQAAAPASHSSKYYVTAGTPAKYEPQAYGRQFPERVDDIAWENDRVAFRCYGPALQKSGEKAWGYDIWNKRTSKMVVENRYAGELDSDIKRAMERLRELGRDDAADDLYNMVSYHVDHGNGMDCYKVGPTLGCGTAAIVASGKICYPRCYKSFVVLDNGPLRFTVRLVYGVEQIDGMNITETRILSLDAGSQLNRVMVSYEGLNKTEDVAVGIVVHNENPNAYVLNTASHYMLYEDLGDPNQYKEKYRAAQNKDFGRIYVGAVVPFATQMKFQAEEGLPGATGHILASTQCDSALPLVYYFGSGWSRNPETNFQSIADWEAYLNQFAAHVEKPLKVKM